jgi:secondary thiamine-phosphate synthase enzyme
MTDTFVVATQSKSEVVNVTARAVERLKAVDPAPKRALACLSTPHTTAALFLGEDDEELRADIVEIARAWLAPLEPFRHIRNQNPNTAAHVLSSVFGTAILVPVEDGELVLGRYQNILLLEMDGPKERSVRIDLYG